MASVNGSSACLARTRQQTDSKLLSRGGLCADRLMDAHVTPTPPNRTALTLGCTASKFSSFSGTNGGAGTALCVEGSAASSCSNVYAGRAA